MISSEEKEKLKEVLGHQYTATVLQELSKKGVLAKNGKPYTANMVRVVFNGTRGQADIEAAIFKAYKVESEKQEAEQRYRASILQTS